MADACNTFETIKLQFYVNEQNHISYQLRSVLIQNHGVLRKYAIYGHPRDVSLIN